MDDKAKWAAINDIVTVCRRMWQKGFVANHDGNVSVRAGDVLLATPTAVSKADVIPENILTLDMNGNKIAGPLKPFSEIQLHLAAYRSRPDVQAVVHAHPSYATACGACGAAIEKIFMPEAVVSIGDNVPVAEFAMPGSPENERIIADIFSRANVCMLPGNGVLAVGKDIMQAYLRLELVEHLAKMQCIAQGIGRPFEMAKADADKLLEKHVAAGLAAPDAAGGKSNLPKQTEQYDDIRRLIAEEINAILGDQVSSERSKESSEAGLNSLDPSPTKGLRMTNAVKICQRGH